MSHPEPRNLTALDPPDLASYQDQCREGMSCPRPPSVWLAYVILDCGPYACCVLARSTGMSSLLSSALQRDWLPADLRVFHDHPGREAAEQSVAQFQKVAEERPGSLGALEDADAADAVDAGSVAQEPLSWSIPTSPASYQLTKITITFKMDTMIPAGTGAADRSTNAPSILAINGAFCGLAVAIVAVRMFVRAMMLKAVGKDDWLILGAVICGIGVFACYIGECANGKGMHTASLRPREIVMILHWQYFHSVIVTVGISLVKLSVAFFLLRLVPAKSYRIFLYCVVAFLVAFTFSSAGTILFSCIPIRANWDRAGEPDAKCFSTNTFTYIGMSNSVVNILTDVLFASLPIPIVWNLQVNIRTKISLIMIMSLGYFACACSIVKTKIQANVFNDRDSYRNDSYFVWNSLELYIGILAASLPTLRALFKSVLDFRSCIKGSSDQRQRKYYMHEEGVGMTPLSKENPHNVKITTKGQPPTLNQAARSLPKRTSRQSLYGAPRAQSEEELPSQGDSDSLDDMLAAPGMRKNCITKTIQVSVER
ncbi:unnamed protein product [Diplocarpon coronariae]